MRIPIGRRALSPSSRMPAGRSRVAVLGAGAPPLAPSPQRPLHPEHRSHISRGYAGDRAHLHGLCVCVWGGGISCDLALLATSVLRRTKSNVFQRKEVPLGGVVWRSKWGTQMSRISL